MLYPLSYEGVARVGGHRDSLSRAQAPRGRPSAQRAARPRARVADEGSAWPMQGRVSDRSTHWSERAHRKGAGTSERGGERRKAAARDPYDAASAHRAS